MKYGKMKENKINIIQLNCTKIVMKIRHVLLKRIIKMVIFKNYKKIIQSQTRVFII